MKSNSSVTLYGKLVQVNSADNVICVWYFCIQYFNKTSH